MNNYGKAKGTAIEKSFGVECRGILRCRYVFRSGSCGRGYSLPFLLSVILLFFY